jgi:hypothetical protein
MHLRLCVQRERSPRLILTFKEMDALLTHFSLHNNIHDPTTSVSTSTSASSNEQLLNDAFGCIACYFPISLPYYVRPSYRWPLWNHPDSLICTLHTKSSSGSEIRARVVGTVIAESQSASRQVSLGNTEIWIFVETLLSKVSSDLKDDVDSVQSSTSMKLACALIDNSLLVMTTALKSLIDILLDKVTSLLDCLSSSTASHFDGDDVTDRQKTHWPNRLIFVMQLLQSIYTHTNYTTSTPIQRPLPSAKDKFSLYLTVSL